MSKLGASNDFLFGKNCPVCHDSKKIIRAFMEHELLNLNTSEEKQKYMNENKYMDCPLCLIKGYIKNR